jgi:8-oxo-dGTP pyrophosphatase MutT (NUDIX family)
MPSPRLSATVLLLRDRSPAEGFEIFMVRRSLRASFMPGAYVFPGGAVDPADGAAEAVCAPIDAAALGARLGRTPEAARAILVAGIRECFEEAGVLLAHGAALASPAARRRLQSERDRVYSGERSLLDLAMEHHLSLALDRFEVFAHWITPAAEPKRFDTYFLVARHPQGQEPLHDRSETIDSTWVTPRRALELHAERSFPLAPPTFVTLHVLCAYASAREVLEAAPSLALPALEPRRVDLDGEIVFLLPGDPLYPPVHDQGLTEGPTRLLLQRDRWIPQAPGQ